MTEIKTYLDKIIDGLKTPTPKHGIGFIPRNVNESTRQPGTHGALAIPYVEHAWIRELLDRVCTPFGWQTDTKDVANLLCVGLGILNPETDEWIWKWDTGHDQPFQEGKQRAASGMSAAATGGRGVFTTSFKRAAYQWGIGGDVQAMTAKWVPCEAYKKQGSDKLTFKRWAKDPATYFGYRPTEPTTTTTTPQPAVPATERDDVDQDTGEILSPQAESKDGAESMKGKCIGYAKTMCEMSEAEAQDFIQPYIDEHGENELAYQIAWNGLVDFRRGRHPSQQ